MTSISKANLPFPYLVRKTNFFDHLPRWEMLQLEYVAIRVYTYSRSKKLTHAKIYFKKSLLRQCFLVAIH